MSGAAARAATVLQRLALLLSLLALGYGIQLALGPWRDQALQVDELHFANCAVQAWSAGSWPSLGCHDNKPPLVYLVYQVLVTLAQGYSPPVLKLAAYAVLAVLTGLCAALGQRLAGRSGALVSASLVLLALAPDSSLHALKTETLGMCLVLSAALLLAPRTDQPGRRRLAMAGLLLGLAVLTKQTYALIPLLLPLWLYLADPQPRTGLRLRGAIVGGLCCGGVALLVLAAFWFWCWSQGRSEDLLASFFLYPAVYGQGPPAGAQAWSYRVVDLLIGVSEQRYLLALGLLAAMLQGLLDRSRPATAPDRLRLLLVLITLALLLPLLVAPNLFTYHLIVIWAMGAPLAAGALGGLTQSLAKRWPAAPALPSLLLLATALTTLVQTWQNQAGHGQSLPAAAPVRLPEAPGRYGYLLGFPDPTFYLDNGLRPSSELLFPWALPGFQASWAYTPPRPGSALADRLGAVQQRNLQRLFADFGRNPPAYIAVVSEPGWQLPSGRVSLVEGVDAYLASHCEQHATRAASRGRQVALFRCF
ncbi:glycosyltransferase family 39 protein [Pelomonas sp. SE-A7]|uniref:glycosyltransferase family 39 protein n=1 Tax=Pelomonas sp. SE-A7 TaxID=3054953 RepID=UPI00259C8FCB|nr:glycosyltransferase family 39 protein [Pelomonas sp. SE-A7]MDM4765837.1 glycosyltransferase family 39 protein [Pelomonas sp. SE-A7]